MFHSILNAKAGTTMSNPTNSNGDVPKLQPANTAEQMHDQLTAALDSGRFLVGIWYVSDQHGDIINVDRHLHTADFPLEQFSSSIDHLKTFLSDQVRKMQLDRAARGGQP